MADKMMRIAGRTSGGVAVPMLAETDGSVDVKRKWKKEWVMLIADTEVRDTNAINATVLDLRDIPMCSLRVVNRLGVPVTLSFYTDVNTSNGYALNDTNGVAKTITVQHSMGYQIITPEDFPLLNYVQYLRIKAVASSAPSSGIFNIAAVTVK